MRKIKPELQVVEYDNRGREFAALLREYADKIEAGEAISAVFAISDRDRRVYVEWFGEHTTHALGLSTLLQAKIAKTFE